MLSILYVQVIISSIKLATKSIKHCARNIYTQGVSRRCDRGHLELFFSWDLCEIVGTFYVSIRSHAVQYFVVLIKYSCLHVFLQS